MPRRAQRPAVLAIGGSDPSCGAGIQADVRTLEAFGVAPTTAVTAITVQDGRRVEEVVPVPANLVGRQIAAALRAAPPKAVKCGMLARAATVEVVAASVSCRGLPLVIDPVLWATGGERLAARGLLRALVQRLLPLAAVVTPNLAEAGALAEIEVQDVEAMITAARRIGALGARAVLVTGGHLQGDPVDVLWNGRRALRLRSPRVSGPEMHGTGCAFASAVAAGLAHGRSLRDSVEAARGHVRELLERAARSSGPARLRPPR